MNNTAELILYDKNNNILGRGKATSKLNSQLVFNINILVTAKLDYTILKTKTWAHDEEFYEEFYGELKYTCVTSATTNAGNILQVANRYLQKGDVFTCTINFEF